MLDLLGLKGAAIGSVLAYGASNVGGIDAASHDDLISNAGSHSQARIVMVDNKALYSDSAEDKYQKGIELITSDRSNEAEFQKGLDLISSAADAGFEDAVYARVKLARKGFASHADDTSALIKTEVGEDLDEAAGHLNDFVIEAPIAVAKQAQSFWKYGFKAIIYDNPEVKPHQDKMAYSLGRSVNSIAKAMAKHMSEVARNSNRT